MNACVELAAGRHELALERWGEGSQASEVDDVAVRHDLTSHICGEVEHALHLHVVEGRVFSHHLAKSLKAHAVPARRGSLYDHLTFVDPDTHLTLAQSVANRFIFLTQNKPILIYSRLRLHGTNMITEIDCKQSVILSLLLCFFKFYSSCKFFLICGHKLV